MKSTIARKAAWMAAKAIRTAAIPSTPDARYPVHSFKNDSNDFLRLPRAGEEAGYKRKGGPRQATKPF